MLSYCALYVDAGYLLASSSTRLSGTSLRSSITVDYEQLIAKLIEQAEKISGLPLLRVNWYDSAPNAVPDFVQERIGLLPKVKIRLGRIGLNGEQKGVDLRIGLDMGTHARNRAVDVVFLISGDDDLTEAVEEAQVHGVRVIIFAVPTNGGTPHGVSRNLQRAADDLELLDAHSLDATVAVRSSEKQLEDISERHPLASPASTPSQLARARRITTATPPVTPAAPLTPTTPLIPAAPTPATVMVYRTETGTTPTTAPEYSRTPEELTADIDRVVSRVYDTWHSSATEEQKTGLLAARPSIPRDIDKALLIDLSDALEYYDLSDAVRHQLRARFWTHIDESLGTS